MSRSRRSTNCWTSPPSGRFPTTRSASKRSRPNAGGSIPAGALVDRGIANGRSSQITSANRRTSERLSRVSRAFHRKHHPPLPFSSSTVWKKKTGKAGHTISFITHDQANTQRSVLCRFAAVPCGASPLRGKTRKPEGAGSGPPVRVLGILRAHRGHLWASCKAPYMFQCFGLLSLGTLQGAQLVSCANVLDSVHMVK